MVLHMDAELSYLSSYKDLIFHTKLLLRWTTQRFYSAIIVIIINKFKIYMKYRFYTTYINGKGKGWSHIDLPSFITTDLSWRDTVLEHTHGIPEHRSFHRSFLFIDLLAKTKRCTQYNDASLRALPNGKSHGTPPPYTHSSYQEKLKTLVEHIIFVILQYFCT